MENYEDVTDYKCAYSGDTITRQDSVYRVNGDYVKEENIRKYVVDNIEDIIMELYGLPTEITW